MSATFWVCETCGVEHARASGVCAICTDERQWVPSEGQKWATLEELGQAGRRVEITELEPDLFGITAEPKVGIGQQAHLVRTPGGNLLWDPIGYLDADAVSRVRELGDVVAIAASHPHMFGVQVQWSKELGGVPVLVSEADVEWVARGNAAIETWSGRREVVPGLTLHQLGGHFPGSSVVHWEAGADGKGVLLVSDTIHGNPDRATVTFLRSYPNRIPLSPAVVQRITRALTALPFDRLYDNFGRGIESGAADAVARSADRYVRWVRGEFDELT
jgi:glyoxylase-like metal-dependent hydrolase (beta-lactamase superfamily II)